MADLYTVCRSAQSDGKKLLSIYLTAGFPERAFTLPLAEAVFEAGADMIEIGIPFSDPIADGPVIQHASTVALRGGIRTDHVFEYSARLAGLGPVILMGYFNSVIGRGAERFLDDASAAQAAGLIIPDLLHEDEPEFRADAERSGLPLIPFVAPTSTLSRMERLNLEHTPFVYAVSVAGVTGVRKGVSQEVVDYVRTARSRLKLPFLVGFGVSDATSARVLSGYSDGVIVGSAIIRTIQESRTLTEAVSRVRDLVRELREALDIVTAKSTQTDSKTQC